MDFNLDGIASLTGALDRLDQGRSAYDLAKRLGLVTPRHATADERKVFLDGRRFSELSHDELSDEHSLWRSELGRLTELVGLLYGNRQILKAKAKSARARARGRIRASLREANEKATATEINDRAEDDPEVISREEELVYLEMLIAQAEAAKEATVSYLEGISREITSRGDQLKGRVFG